MLKVTTINRLYSTGFYDIGKMSYYIFNLKIDNELSKGELSLVNKIAYGHGISRKNSPNEIRCYSFATKYCNWHRQDAYPIYDSFVENILCEYNSRNNFSDFAKGDLRNYDKFTKVISDFIQRYSLTESNFKKIDKFLWKYGKERAAGLSVVKS